MREQLKSLIRELMLEIFNENSRKVKTKGCSVEEGPSVWDYAPKHAKYFAVDKNGEGWFYKKKPMINMDAWDSNGNMCNTKPVQYNLVDWKNSLQKRPC